MKYSSFRKENQEISRKWASSLLNSFKQISVQTKSLPTFLRDFGSAKCPPGYRSSKWEWSSFQSKAMYWFPSWLTVGKRTPQSLLTHTRCPFNLLSWVISLNQTNSISSSNQWREQITVSASPFCTHRIWIKSTVQTRKNNSRNWIEINFTSWINPLCSTRDFDVETLRLTRSWCVGSGCLVLLVTSFISLMNHSWVK